MKHSAMTAKQAAERFEAGSHSMQIAFPEWDEVAEEFVSTPFYKVTRVIMQTSDRAVLFAGVLDGLNGVFTAHRDDTVWVKEG